MTLFAELYDYLDPTEDEERDPVAIGEHYRPTFSVGEEVGRRTIQKVQPELEGHSLGQFFENLGENIGEFAQGLFTAATYPVRHPVATAEALADPLETGKRIGGAIVENYKQSYTPQPDESIPGMILRRLYEKPFDTLMDASALGQLAFGGAGLVARGATAGTRGAAMGAEAARSIARASGAALPALTEPELQLAARAASATRTIDLFDAAASRARAMDPITLALRTGTTILQTVAPDRLAAIRTTSRLADSTADRIAELSVAENEATRKTVEAFGHLNDAERAVVHPYIAGRVNFDNPIGEQLLTHTGEWVPLKGEVIRPEALEQARQAYIPIQQELQGMRGMLPEQVQQRAAAKALREAKTIIGDEFDPFSAETQDYVLSEVQSALQKNDEVLKSRATGEVRTSLDLAKEGAWRTQVEQDIEAGKYADLKEAEAGLPRPERITVEEAMRAMGPQGGIYFPHSSEAFTRDQSTIRNVLTKYHEASTFKENEYALYAAGVLEHQDPVKQILRAYATFNEGKTWLQASYETAERLVEESKSAPGKIVSAIQQKLGIKAGKTERMGKEWNYATDPDVIAGTHQPFHPGRVLADDLIEEEGQRMLTRLMEVVEEEAPVAREALIEARTVPLAPNAAGPRAPRGLPAGVSVGNLNYMDIMKGLVEQADKGPIFRQRAEIPMYKVPKHVGHAFKAFKDQYAPATNPFVQQLDNVTQWWNWANLNVRVTRVVNNVLGNTGFIAMMGVQPFTPRGVQTLVAMGKGIGHKLGLTNSEEAAKLAKVFDLPGIRAAGLQQSLLEATGTVGERVAQLGKGGGRLARAAGLPARGVGKWAQFMAETNVHAENLFRSAGLFYELTPNIAQRVRRMAGYTADTMTLGDKIAEFAKAGGEVTMKNGEYRAALRSVNRYFHDYSRVTPFERTMIRRVFPYYKFFKHSTELITRFPFEHPLKAAVGRAMGDAAMQDAKDLLSQWGLNWNRDVPPQMRESIPVMRETDPRTGIPVIWMYNSKGQNPFSQMSGEPAEEILQLLNPVVKVLLEQSTGINLYRRERYRGEVSSYTGREIDSKSGQIVDSFNHPSFGEAFLRSFWPYQTVRELVAQGRVPTDTASLLDMATNAPNAWQYDKRGFPVRKPIVSSLQALSRFAGPIPQPLQAPTKEQRTSRKAAVSQQLHTLFQRHPEKREEILRAMQETAQEIVEEYNRGER